jgi:uncharacterized RDD family membrane protein YckC
VGRVSAPLRPAVLTELPPAGFWRRQGAWWLDRLLGVFAWSLGAMWLVLALWAVRGLPRGVPGVGALLVAIALLGLVLRVSYQVAFVGGCGQTPGQMACRIAVVGRDGAPPGYGRATLRGLAGVLSVVTLGVTSLIPMFRRDRRGLADLLSGTHLVLVRTGGDLTPR